ncbi:hypothetical protein A3L22_13775 [Streptomyces griseus subsp. griseus]|nr:hypothetical protein A3L22_13775 [Streptomyces griseus subsp. griseus]
MNAAKAGRGGWMPAGCEPADERGQVRPCLAESPRGGPPPWRSPWTARPRHRTPQRAAVVTLAPQAAVPHLLTNGPGTLAAAGLEDPDRFVRDLLDTVYPP